MARLTSKYQLTIPKAIAENAGLKPGDEIDCEAGADLVRITRKHRLRAPLSVTDKLILFDMATERVRHRDPAHRATGFEERGWTRNELYER